MPRMYYCSLKCAKKSFKGWCKDDFAVVDEDGKCDGFKPIVKREQVKLF